ncbi:MAG: hypothetical protein ACK55I_46880, partial [bacterium]
RAAPDAAGLRAVECRELGGPLRLGGFAAAPIPRGRCRVGFGKVWQQYPGRALAVPRGLAENHVPVFIDETGGDADAGCLASWIDGMKTKLLRLELAIAVEVAPSVGPAEFREVELLLRHGIDPGLGRLLLVSNDARNRRGHEPPLFRIQTQHRAAFVDHIG